MSRTHLAKKCLLSGFEPFGGSRINPSEEVVRALRGTSIEGMHIVGLVLPVASPQAGEHLLAAVEMEQPDAVVCLGEASRRAAISVERVFINLRDDSIPDNAGVRLIDQPILVDGPPACFTTLPVRAMVAAIARAGIPAELSLSAGTFLCNEVAYRLLHAMSLSPPVLPAGFIHLQRLPAQVDGVQGAPTMPLEVTVRGIQVALGVMASELRRGTPASLPA